MRPLHLRLQGFTTFRDELELDLREIPPGLVALVGPNGAGKTTLLEALGCAAIFRAFPSRPGPLRSSAVRRDAILDVLLEHGGETWRLLHLTDPRDGRGAFALRGGGEPDPTITGRVADFDALVRAHFPSQSVFLASAFGAQTGAGNFLELSEADQRALFARLLGLWELQARADEATAEAQRLEAEVRELDVEVALAQAERERARDYAHRLHDAEQRATGAREALGRAEVELEALRATAAPLRAAAEGTSAAAHQAADRVRELEHDARLAREDLDVAQRHVTEIRAKLAALDPSAEAELLQTQQQLQEAQAAVVEARAQHIAAVEAQRAAEVVAARAQGARRALARAEEDARLLGEVPCRGRRLLDAGSPEVHQPPVVLDLGTCPLLVRARAAQGEAEQLQADLGPVEQAEASLPGLRTAAQSAREALAQADARLAEAQRRERALQDGVALARQAEQLRAALARWEGEAAGAADDVAGWVEDLAAARAVLQKALARDAEARDAAEAAEARVDAAAAQLGLLTGRAASAAEELSRTQAQHPGDVQGRAEQAEGRRAEAARRLAAARLLQASLGPRGLQALEVDAAGPAITELANAMLDEALGARFSVQLTTLAEKARGGLKETFDLVVYDGPSPRPVSTLSGGERVLVDEAVKLALAIFAGRSGGARLETLYRDECDGALSPELAARWPAMLRAAAQLGGFRNVFFVSHRPEVSDQAETRIHVGGGRARIEIA